MNELWIVNPLSVFSILCFSTAFLCHLIQSAEITDSIRAPIKRWLENKEITGNPLAGKLRYLLSCSICLAPWLTAILCLVLNLPLILCLATPLAAALILKLAR